MSYARSLLWGCNSAAQAQFLRLCEVLVLVAVLERERRQERFGALRLNERVFFKKKKIQNGHWSHGIAFVRNFSLESIVVNIHRVRGFQEFLWS